MRSLWESLGLMLARIVLSLRRSFVLTCGNNRRCCAEPARSSQCDSGSDLVMLEASNVFE